jgi:Acyltransferase family
MASQTKPGPSLLEGAAGTTAPITSGSAQGTRLWFVDHLRLVLICGVVIAHVASIYGGGGWYQYRNPGPTDALSGYILIIPSLIAEMFGMGFFFLLAGYFTPGAYDRKGGASFLRDRLIRLGIPLLVYDLLLDPLVVYIARGQQDSYWSFYGPYLLQMRTIGSVVAWFIATLLLFTLLYAAWRALASSHFHPTQRPGTLPSMHAILGFIVALGLVSFVVRIWWPLSWGWPAWWLQLFNLKGGLLPQYLSLYILGCLAYRRNWFDELTPRMGRYWSLIALIAILGAIPIMVFGWATGTINDYLGGFHWQALVMAAWEAFLVVGVCISSLVLFRQHWNRQGRMAKALATSVFAVYLIHPLVVVSVASAFSALALYPLLKFFIAVLIVLPLSFLLALVIRKLPLTNRIL